MTPEEEQLVPQPIQPARARAQRGRGAALHLPSSPGSDAVPGDMHVDADNDDERGQQQQRRRIVRGRDIVRHDNTPPRARSFSPMPVSPAQGAAARRRGGRSDRFARSVVTFEDADEEEQYASADEVPARGTFAFLLFGHAPCATILLRYAHVFYSREGRVLCAVPFSSAMRSLATTSCLARVVDSSQSTPSAVATDV